MMNIAICDDQNVYVEIIMRHVEDYFRTKKIRYSISTFTSSQKLLESEMVYDIVFLDVDMPDLDGIALGKELRKRKSTSFIIYVSAYIEYAIDGYSVQAFQYLLKNDLEKTFKQCMDDVMTMMPSIMEAYFIPSDAGGVKVPLRNILYFEVQNHTIYAHILDYSRDHLCYAGKISSIESDLNNKGFLRIHKSYLVNMKHIERITKTHVHLTNSIELPCSRKNYSEILTKYMLWEAQE